MQPKKQIIINSQEDKKNLDDDKADINSQRVNNEDDNEVPDKLIGDDLDIKKAGEGKEPETDSNEEIL